MPLFGNNFSGGVMHGPNGETWTGVNSKDDAMNIIAHKLKQARKV